MAVADFFSGFGYKWAQSGSVYNWDDAQYKQGWSTIGATPPSVEQFNRAQQFLDEKANWLFAQISAAAVAKGVALTALDLQGLKKILDAYAPNATTSVRGQVQLATSSDVTGGVNATNAITASLLGLASPMRGISTYQSPGTFTWAKPAGVSRVWVIVTAGGGAGGGGTGYNSPNSTRGGGGGAGGTVLMLTDVSSVSSVAVTVGAGGTGSSVDGKDSKFGTFCSATGGKSGITAPNSNRIASGKPGVGVGSGNAILISGGWGSDVAAPANASGGSGDGGASYWGGGVRSGWGGVAGRGSADAAPGAGGGGCDINERGAGQSGIVIVQY